MADEQPWYKDGLKFSCSGCGNCCTGAPGYVWVNQAEIQAMAECLGTTVARFEAQHVRKVGIRKSLIELPESNYDCTFFDSETRQCKVYEVRPRQCRTWPFWDSNVRTEETWQACCEVCPGSGKGEKHDAHEIQHRLAVIKI
jgi:Fe-S-cluster containining protein